MRIIWIAACMMVAVTQCNVQSNTPITKSELMPVEQTIAELPTIDRWSVFTEALILVESEGKCTARGSKDDVGVLQITPILVKDVNRIVGHNKYSLDDRLDRNKSIEMFNIIQEHYNPDKDFHLALKIWNGRAPLSYHTKVMRKYNELIKQGKI